MPAQQISNAFQIEVDGSPMQPVDLTRAEVEDHLHLPDAFTLTFRDAARTALGTAKLKIGAKVKISVLSDASAAPVKLLEGEVTALESEFHGGTSTTIVRGYDQSHRLLRGRVTHSYLKMTYKDVAEEVATRHQLTGGTIDATSPTHAHVSQSNESDWSFLGRLAAEVGYELTVSDEKLHFRHPGAADGAPSDRDLTSDDPLALMPGNNLLYIRASVTAAEQVKDVEVRGWDQRAKTVLKATAPTRTDAAKNGSSSAAVAAVFPSPALVSTGMMLGTNKAAEQAATALADRVAAGQTEIEGQARGNARLKAGAAVRVAQMGEPFDGRYVLTSTRHSYDPEEGYVTWFSVSGRQERSTLSLAGGGGGANGGGAANVIDGVVPAIVDDVDDPDGLCRVRLRFPWMSDQYVSDWSRVAQAGAGHGRGMVILPEPGDEVLVAFDQGDIRRPFVLGSLYNDKDRPDTGPGQLIDGSSKAVNNRLFTSRRGHQLVFVDTDQDCSVEIHSGDRKLVVRLDQTKKKITINSGGDLELQATGNIKIDAGGRMALKASGSLSVKGQTIELN
jgi:uncharacterized protein involved in type VI secretion and phage assembly